MKVVTPAIPPSGIVEAVALDRALTALMEKSLPVSRFEKRLRVLTERRRAVAIPDRAMAAALDVAFRRAEDRLATARHAREAFALAARTAKAITPLLSQWPELLRETLVGRLADCVDSAYCRESTVVALLAALQLAQDCKKPEDIVALADGAVSIHFLHANA